MAENKQKKISLIDITMQIQSAVEQIVESGGEVTEETFADLDLFRGQLEQKAGSIAYVIKNIMNSRIDRLAELKKQAENKLKAEKNAQARLKEYLLKAMKATDTKKVKSDLYSITVCSGRKSAEITNLTELPGEYVKKEIVLKPDKKALLDDLEKGKSIQGAELVTGADYLLIK